MLFPNRRVITFFLLWPALSLLAAQGNSGQLDSSGFVGMTLGELIDSFGVPESVYAVRGREAWQDDVVFVYNEGDFYIYKDRVWQLGLNSYRGINAGDPEAVVFLTLDPAPDLTRRGRRQNSVFYSFNEGSWPMILRFDLDNSDRVRVIFIYRTDF